MFYLAKSSRLSFIIRSGDWPVSSCWGSTGPSAPFSDGKILFIDIVDGVSIGLDGVEVDDLGVDRALLLLANFLSSGAINEIAVFGRLSLSLLFKAPPSFLVKHCSHLKYTI